MVCGLPAWLELVEVRQVDPGLPVALGAGEREAISLAIEKSADLLLIDERAGREAAEARQVVVAGTLAVLLQAGLRGRVDFPTHWKNSAALASARPGL